MGMESAMSPDDQTTIVPTYQQRQSSVNATVVEFQRSPPGSTLPSRTVSILLGEFLLVNDTQTDEILPPQFDESIDTGLPTSRCRRWRRFSSVRRRCSPPSGCGSGLTMSAEGRDTAADNPLVSPVASASIRGSTHPACCATSSPRTSTHRFFDQSPIARICQVHSLPR